MDVWHLDTLTLGALVVKHQIINLLNCQLCKNLKNCGLRSSLSCHYTFQFYLIFIQILAVRHHLWQCCMESKPGRWEKLSEIQQKDFETKKCAFPRTFLSCIQLKVWSSQMGLIWICKLQWQYSTSGCPPVAKTEMSLPMTCTLFLNLTWIQPVISGTLYHSFFRERMYYRMKPELQLCSKIALTYW